MYESALIAAGFAFAWLGLHWYRRRALLLSLAESAARLADGQQVRTSTRRMDGAIGELSRAIDAASRRVVERERRLHSDLRQMRVVLDGMADAVLAVDSRGRLTFANATANRLFALDAHSIQRLIVELIREPKIQNAVATSLAAGGPYRGEIAVTNLDTLGRVHERVFEAHGSSLPGEATTGIVLVLHDVTELRRLERTRRDFVANASHELKTPLSSIKAYTETLLDWGLEDPDVNVRFLTRINEQADRLHQLILDMLSLARLDSGDSGWERRPLAVVPAVEGYVESHRARAESKGLTIVFRTTSISRADAIMGDEEALRQIVDNLIDNAIKYTPEGGRVEVGCRLAADEIRIEVSDTGIGIPRDELPRVFERFYRVDKARSRELGGTGLGLSIVKHLTQALEGRVEVESRLGRGSTFTVYLPRPAVAEAGVAAARPAAAHA